MHLNSASVATEAGPQNGAASLGTAILAMLESLLPEAAADVERDSAALCAYFSVLTRYIADQNNAVPPAVADAMAGIITHLQFQDRLTQTMDSAAGIIRACRDFCEDRRDIETQDMAREILASIRLASVRAHTLKTLQDFRIILQPVAEESSEAHTMIELF